MFTETCDRLARGPDKAHETTLKVYTEPRSRTFRSLCLASREVSRNHRRFHSLKKRENERIVSAHEVRCAPCCPSDRQPR